MDVHRLSTADEDGKRIYLYPEEVKGKWNTWRMGIYYLLIAIYIVLPWSKMGGHQTILLDIPRREFFIFGGHFYAHNIPLLFIAIVTFLISMALITAVVGRIWCGMACPQSVFIEGLFRKIEGWIEGASRRRMHLDASPWNSTKLGKKALKWTLFTLVSLIIAHSFLAYFVPVEELIKIIRHSPKENLTLFFIMLGVSAIVLFDFGWFREQFCIIACPYGRLQSVLMDKDSLLVAYDYNRGEPRKNPGVKEHGDCINCYKCVHVCPTGIDIRRGSQLECIQCTKCIDACNKIMQQIKKPLGLIRYSTDRQLQEGGRKVLRPRVWFYSAILLFCLIGGGYLIVQSKSVEVLFLQGAKEPYQTIIKEGRETIINHYKAEFFYRGDLPLDLSFTASYPGVEIITPRKKMIIKAARKSLVHIFFRFSPHILHQGRRKIKVSILSQGKLLTTKEITLTGPYGPGVN